MILPTVSSSSRFYGLIITIPSGIVCGVSSVSGTGNLLIAEDIQSVCDCGLDLLYWQVVCPTSPPLSGWCPAPGIAIEASDRCIVARIACVVLALHGRTWSIMLPPFLRKDRASKSEDQATTSDQRNNGVTCQTEA